MMLVNITTKVEKAIEQLWLEWMMEICLYKLSKEQQVKDCKLYLLMIDDDEPTYALQIFFNSLPDYEKYIKENSAQFYAEQQRLFSNRLVSFETVMQEII